MIMWKQLLTISSIQQIAQFQSVPIRPRDLPWIHNQIRQYIRKRNRLHEVAEQTNKPDAWARFRESRNKVTAEIPTM